MDNGSQLLSAIERIERLHEEKKNLEEDVREIYSEIAAQGYDKKAVREIVKRRSKDPSERTEFEAIVELYEQAIAQASRAPAGRAREEAA